MTEAIKGLITLINDVCFCASVVSKNVSNCPWQINPRQLTKVESIGERHNLAK